jgi:TPR repeat protein
LRRGLHKGCKGAGKGNKGERTGKGKNYEKGYGIKKDPQEAVKWYRKAAKQGDKNAQEALERLQK